MHSTSVHALKKKSVTNGGGETLPAPPGILAETKALLQHYRAELLTESGRLLQEGDGMRAHQPGSTPIDIPETVQNPAHTPAPERAPTEAPDKVPEKVIAPASFDAFFSDQIRHFIGIV